MYRINTRTSFSVQPISLLREVVSYLDANGISTIIFGGWAEELQQMIPPREHKDIDLLYISKNFVQLDFLLKKDINLMEIKEKHVPHKRAFLYKEVMIELFLVQKEEERYFTNFHGRIKHYWPGGLRDNHRQTFPIASQQMLSSYRTNYEMVKL